jgi:TetR/AcrR family transcriptional repressor of mexJK operon
MSEKTPHLPPSAPAPARVGRPRELAKRQAVLDAAFRLFLSEGVQGTSLDAVARAAGVSRVTLYSHFPDKAALFEATIRDEMDRLARTQVPLAEGVALRDGLVAFGRALMGYVTSPKIVSFYSVLAGELRRHPDLARQFYVLGPGETHRNLAAILARAAEHGEIAVPCPLTAAEHLIGLWQGMTSYKLALALDVEEIVAGLDERVEGAVTAFLAAYAPRGG